MGDVIRLPGVRDHSKRTRADVLHPLNPTSPSLRTAKERWFGHKGLEPLVKINELRKSQGYSVDAINEVRDTILATQSTTLLIVALEYLDNGLKVSGGVSYALCLTGIRDVVAALVSTNDYGMLKELRGCSYHPYTRSTLTDLSARGFHE